MKGRSLIVVVITIALILASVMVISRLNDERSQSGSGNHQASLPPDTTSDIAATEEVRAIDGGVPVFQLSAQDAVSMCLSLVAAKDNNITIDPNDIVAREMTLGEWETLEQGGRSSSAAYGPDEQSTPVWVVVFKTTFSLEASTWITDEITDTLKASYTADNGVGGATAFEWPDGKRQGYVVLDKYNGQEYERGIYSSKRDINLWDSVNAVP
jgi:hypothetical protein